MPKLEKIAGVVALSYLVLIPVAGVLAYRKLQEIDGDVNALWSEVMDKEPRPEPKTLLSLIKR